MSNMVLSSEDVERAPGLEGWKRILVTMAGVALATAVSLLVLNVAAQANAKSAPVAERVGP
ncbi:hypothetical protein L6R52_17725 [Myxococcota bacterium]|nr:hypothetical protein [Myxococcota bacterium]